MSQRSVPVDCHCSLAALHRVEPLFECEFQAVRTQLFCNGVDSVRMKRACSGVRNSDGVQNCGGQLYGEQRQQCGDEAVSISVGLPNGCVNLRHRSQPTTAA